MKKANAAPGQIAKRSWQAPEFSTAPWYSNLDDHRCPRDASLESVEVRKSDRGVRSAERPGVITITLLSANHDGRIVFAYSGVRSHSLPSYLCDQGVGDWLRDEFTKSEAGFTSHRITWCSGASGTSQWVIEAEEVTYEWIPNTASQRARKK